MKRNIFIILLISVLWSSCSEDVLNVKNEGNFTADTFFTNANTIIEASTAVYAAYQFRGLQNREYFFIFDLFGNDAEKNFPLQGSMLDFPGYTHSSITGELNYFYIANYQLIFRANFAIDAVQKWAPTAASDIAIGQRVVAEAKFCKALSNFWLVTSYGDIPLKKKLEDHYDLLQGRTPKAQVWSEIETDLLSAIEVLPVTYPDADYGRATKGAAIALLGKVYLYQKKYTEANGQFSKLLAAPYTYDLAGSLDDIFTKDLKTKENIFQVIHGKWNGLVRGGRSEMSGGYYTHTRHSMEYGFADWWNVLVSDAAVASFHYQDEAGNPYVDPRAPLTFYDNLGTKGGDKIYCEQCPKGPLSYAAKVGVVKPIYSFRKYELYEERDKYGTPDSWINSQIIRFADVLLMLAECYIDQPTPDLEKARVLINRVRARSGAFEYTTLGDKAKATAILRHERQIELFGEQVRFPDLVRWGILEETINNEKFAFNGTRPVKPFHVLFPFPQEERDANPVLNAQITNNWN